jgi:hypothetical protein
MKWRDFFYFSKGERQALAILLILIAAAWLTVRVTDEQPLSAGEEKYPSEPVHTESIHTAPVHTPVSKPPFYQPRAKAEKFPAGTVVELNTADTTVLKKVPGIGSAFSRRIVKYRDLLGGFYSVAQLAEVFGIDAERYDALQKWFCADPRLIRKLPVNSLPADSLARHPYVSYRQARVIKQYGKQKGRLESWNDLLLLEEFSDADKVRTEPYFSFE